MSGDPALYAGMSLTPSCTAGGGTEEEVVCSGWWVGRWVGGLVGRWVPPGKVLCSAFIASAGAGAVVVAAAAVVVVFALLWMVSVLAVVVLVVLGVAVLVLVIVLLFLSYSLCPAWGTIFLLNARPCCY